MQLKSRQMIEMPKGARIVSVANQEGRICIWALVDSEEENVDAVEVFIVGTGNPNPIPDDAKNFIGTVLMGEFVWHVFTR